MSMAAELFRRLFFAFTKRLPQSLAAVVARCRLRFIFVLFSFYTSSSMAMHKAEKTFLLGKTSSIRLEGFTNLQQFHCTCHHSFLPQKLSFSIDDKAPQRVYFQNTCLRIPIIQLDCGNPLINKEMYKALNAGKHPDILIELHEVSHPSLDFLHPAESRATISARVALTINGRCLEHGLHFQAHRLSDAQYRFLGSKTLSMSRFGIDPPQAMFGMIKVKDEIKIHLDLDLRVE